MIWLAAALLALAAILPAAAALKRRISVKGRQEMTLALYRAQIVELDRDLAERRISVRDHGTAMVEVQRRLLAAAEAADASPSPPARFRLVFGLALVPLAAFGLYLVNGQPGMPSQPLAERMARADRELAAESTMIQQLRAALATLDPLSDRAREGEVLLGNLQAERGDFAEAAKAWGRALSVKFDPLLAAQVADATSRAEGRISPASADLFRRALAAAPADAPWRGAVEQRLAEAGK